jgi:hypothetical protein
VSVRPSSSCGIVFNDPSVSNDQPWYGHSMHPEFGLTLPCDSGAKRWGHASTNALHSVAAEPLLASFGSGLCHTARSTPQTRI